MTQDEIIEMAKQAGLFTHKEVQPEIKAFAALVAAAEREACAKMAENRALIEASDIEKTAHYTACKNIASQIRARDKT